MSKHIDFSVDLRRVLPSLYIYDSPECVCCFLPTSPTYTKSPLSEVFLLIWVRGYMHPHLPVQPTAQTQCAFLHQDTAKSQEMPVLYREVQNNGGAKY